MFVDFVLLWSASIAFLKLAMKNYISIEAAAFLMLAALFVVAATRMAGSNVLRERSRIPKFFLSLMLFALSVADGDIKVAISVAIWTSALPICLFGLYISLRSAFGKM